MNENALKTLKQIIDCHLLIDIHNYYEILLLIRLEQWMSCKTLNDKVDELQQLQHH